jgi:hypothetical protein
MPEYCPYCKSTCVWKQPEHFRAKEWVSPREHRRMKGQGEILPYFDIEQFKCGGCFRVFYVEAE